MNYPFFGALKHSIMHKKLLITLLTLGLTSSAFSQTFPYGFTYSNEPYVPLANATVLDSNEVFDQGSIIPLGFNFKFDGVYYDQLLLDGYEFALTPVDQFFSDTIDAIFGYNTIAGFIPSVNTIARYTTDGVAPNRIAKIEIYRGSFVDAAGEASAQVWLYETTNAIQIRIGNQTIPSPSDVFYNEHSPLIGYMNNYHSLTSSVSIFPKAQFVVGTPENPQDSVIVNGLYNQNLYEGPQYGQTAIPLNNSVFTFAPGTVATHQPLTQSLSITPNPAYDMVRLNGIDAKGALQIELLDMQGRQIKVYTLNDGERNLQLPEQTAPGTYLVRCTAEGKTVTGRLIKM